LGGRRGASQEHPFSRLTVIGGNAELARRQVQGFSGEATECLDQISAAADLAPNLTRQLLAFS
jgi:hypothetical protein